MGCRIRPYEKVKGQTDEAVKQAVRILNMAFEGRTTREDSLKIALAQFETIETYPRENRPKVGIFGDFYVRDNNVMNQNLIHFIEEHGGEVVTTPYYRFAKMIAESYFKKWFKEGRYLSLIANKAILTTMTQLEKGITDILSHSSTNQIICITMISKACLQPMDFCLNIQANQWIIF